MERRRLPAALVVAVLLGGGLLLTADPAAAYLCAPVQITTTSSIDAVGDLALSDDGQVTAFASNEDLDPAGDNSDGNKELFTHEPGVGFTQITDTTSGSVSEISIDGDGDTIVFQASMNLIPPDNSDQSREIFLYDAVLDEFTQLTQTSGTGGTLPRINDAGSIVVFSSSQDLVGQNADLNSEIFGYPVPGLVVQITETTTGDSFEPAIGGDLVAFGSSADLDPAGDNSDGSDEIFTFLPSSGEFTQITDDPAEGSYSASVSGDDSTVVFSSSNDFDPAVGNADGNGEVFAFDVATQDFTQVTDGTFNSAGTATVDGDGDRVAFVSSNSLDPNVDNSDSNQEVFVADVTDGEVDQVTDTVTTQGGDYPSIDASGTRVAFTTRSDLTGDNPDGRPELVIADCGANGPTYSDLPATNAFYEHVEWMAAADVAQGFNDGTFRGADGVKRSNMANFLYNLAGRPAFTPPGSPTFSDYPATRPYYRQVEWMVAEGIASGFNDGTFRPDDLVKRSNMANFLYNLAGQPPFVAPGSPTFSDYPATSVYYVAVEWMVAEGIANGFNDGTYRPNDPVKRQQMANFLYNLTAGPGVDV